MAAAKSQFFAALGFESLTFFHTIFAAVIQPERFRSAAASLISPVSTHRI
jgi:hypothetical protein